MNGAESMKKRLHGCRDCALKSQVPDLLAARRRLLVTCPLRFFLGRWQGNGRTERQGETGLGPGTPVGTTEQGIPQGIEPLTEREWIDLLNPLAQIPLPILREHPRGQQTLQGRLGDIIHPLHPVASGARAPGA